MFEIVNEQAAGPVIRVVGVGGAGGNAVIFGVKHLVGFMSPAMNDRTQRGAGAADLQIQNHGDFVHGIESAG